MTIKKKWCIAHPDETKVKQLAEQLQVSTITAKILVARNIETAEQAKPLLTVNEADYHDPFLMHGMEDTVARIEQALEEGEKILVYGDYDAGATRF